VQFGTVAADGAGDEDDNKNLAQSAYVTQAFEIMFYFQEYLTNCPDLHMK